MQEHQDAGGRAGRRPGSTTTETRYVSLALITGTYPLLTTTFIDREIEALRRRGFDIRVLAMRRPDQAVPLSVAQRQAVDDVTYLLPASWPFVLTSHLKALARNPIKFITTLSMLLTARHPSWRSRLKTILHFGEGVVASEILRDWDFDEIQGHFVDRAATISMVASRLTGKPYTLSVHAGQDVFVEKVLLPEKLGNARQVVTCTRFNKTFLTELVGQEIGDRIVSIPHGLDLSLYERSEEIPTEVPTIIAVGQLTERKGLMDLVEACSLLRDRGALFRCHIIGTGPLESRLASRIEELDLGGTVELRGSLSHDDVVKEYRAASVFALPCVESRDGNRDGIPNVIPEAMATGLPVVSTPISAIPEVVDDGETGTLVEPHQPEMLADALQALLSDVELRDRLGQAAKEKITEIFDVEDNVDRLVRELWPVNPSGASRMKWVAVAWAPYSRRSEMFSKELGGPLYCIHYLKFRSPMHAPLKYVMQAIKTMAVLMRERPDAVHVQNPPFVCGLVVWLYTKIFGGSFVTEFHSAAFGSAWDWALPVQRVLARAAVVNIVTSSHWSDLVESWGGEALVMHDAFLELGSGTPYELRDGFNIGFIGTFAPDEPVAEVIEAARRVPDVNFYITGDPALKPKDLGPIPDNVVFTGFLDLNTEYLGLLNSIDAAMVLTTRDHTLQLAGCEAIGAGKPIITSDWDYLRGLFGDAAVYVSSDASSIETGVKEMVSNHAEITRQVGVTRERGKRIWRERIKELRELVASDLKRKEKPAG